MALSTSDWSLCAGLKTLLPVRPLLCTLTELKACAHRLEVERHGLAALKLVDHLRAPGEAQEVQVGEPAPVDRLVLIAQEQAHKEQQHCHIRRQRCIGHVHVGRDRRNEVADGCMRTSAPSQQSSRAPLM